MRIILKWFSSWLILVTLLPSPHESRPLMSPYMITWLPQSRRHQQSVDEPTAAATTLSPALASLNYEKKLQKLKNNPSKEDIIELLLGMRKLASSMRKFQDDTKLNLIRFAK